MSWLTTKLLGIRNILLGGVPLPERQSFNFVAGATVTDNPTLKTTDITIDASSVFTDATSLPVPSTIVKRSFGGGADFASICHFASLTASGNVDIDGNMNANGNGVVSGQFDCYGRITCGDDIVTSSDVYCSGLQASNGIACIGTVSGSHFQLSGAYAETRIQQALPKAVTDTNWAVGAGGVAVNGLVGSSLYLPLTLPHGSIITTFLCHIAPVGHANLPQNMPTLYLRRWDISAGIALTVGSQVDTSANAGNYSAPHDISIFPNHTVDKVNYRYYLELVAESGANSAVGTVFQYCSTTHTRSAGSNIGQD